MKRPGTTIIQIGLVLVLVGVLFAVVSLANGGHAGLLALSAVGLIVSAVGFGIRVLAALERR